MNPFDPHDFLRRAARRLHMSPVDAPFANVRGDHEGQEEPVDMQDPAAAKAAAVLVPVVTHTTQATVLLTRRSAHLSSHAGQIAFPGGRIDPDDEGPGAAAHREAFEEIGLAPGTARPLGFLDPYLSSTGYCVMPLIARLDPGFRLVLNPDEVDEAFEVPLSLLMDPSRHERHSRVWNGVRRSYYAIQCGDRYIYGVTAGIIRNLYEKLYLP